MNGAELSSFERRFVERVVTGDARILETLRRQPSLAAYWDDLLARYRAYLITSIERGAPAASGERTQPAPEAAPVSPASTEPHVCHPATQTFDQLPGVIIRVIGRHSDGKKGRSAATALLHAGA